MGNELVKARQTIESLSRQLSEAQIDNDRLRDALTHAGEIIGRYCSEYDPPSASNKTDREIVEEYIDDHQIDTITAELIRGRCMRDH